MTFLELAGKRESIRSYKGLSVENEKIDRCLEAARLSPSACNAQPWEFVVISQPEKVVAVAKATREAISGMNKWTDQAPVMVAVVAKKPNLSSRFGAFIKNRPFYLMDLGMAAEHFCLQAAEENLGTCMLGWFDEKKIRKIIDHQGSDRIMLIITLGYPENAVTRKKVRKERGEISRFIS